MKAFRQIMMAICAILIASAFAGCGADTDSPDERPALDKIEYTNLNDVDFPSALYYNRICGMY